MDNQIKLTREDAHDYGFDEALKTLRTNVQFCGSNVRVVMFTSTVPNEGKSKLAFSFAASMAQIGKKVLFIDADIRKSVLVTRYRPNREVDGLSQYLCGQKEIEDIIYETNHENMHMIFSGPYAPNPAELLEEAIFDDLLKQAKEEYEYIVIDTPPMANLIDGAIIAGRCDGAVMVVQSGGVSYKMVQKAKIQLEKSGCRILGVALNKVAGETYGYYGKYKGYEIHGRYKKGVKH